MKVNLTKFIYKRKVRVLQRKIMNYLNESFHLSTKDRSKSDEMIVKANEVQKEIDELNRKIRKL